MSALGGAGPEAPPSAESAAEVCNSLGKLHGYSGGVSQDNSTRISEEAEDVTASGNFSPPTC